MTRIDLIQAVVKAAKYRTYLEIGVRSGTSFFPVRCRNKVAIDPAFKIPWEKKAKWMILNPANLRSHFFQETSDAFFEYRKGFLDRLGKLDAVLVDGLHSFEASLQDVMNSLNYLSPGGVIILHDCLPLNEAAAMPTKHFPTKEEQEVEGWTGIWNGDVWKTIVYLRRHHPESLQVCVLDTDYGLGIVRKRTHSAEPYSVNREHAAEINRMLYREVAPRLSELLDVRPLSFVPELIDELKKNKPSTV